MAGKPMADLLIVAGPKPKAGAPASVGEGGEPSPAEQDAIDAMDRAVAAGSGVGDAVHDLVRICSREYAAGK